MPHENPYQSPESTSKPELAQRGDEPVQPTHPTWRLWALAAISCTVFYFVYLFIQIASNYSELDPARWFVSILAIAAIFGIVSSVFLTLFFWRGARTQPTLESARPQLFFAALWFLTLFAIPSAFVSICTPTLFVMNQNPWFRGLGVPGWLAGLLLGAVGALVTNYIARGLWRDAIGKSKRE